MYSDILPEFKEFLVSQGLVSSKKAPFCAYWVSKFIAFCNNNKKAPAAAEIRMFLSQLNSNKAADWQIEQAEGAVKLYLEHFVAKNEHSLSATSFLNKQGADNIIRKMQEAIRVKHYSYSTERSYLGWAKSFFSYLRDIKNKNILPRTMDVSDITDYLTYLAVERKVASSTQNQAFNALLFLFRGVLKIKTNDLSKAVRAKRGPKLPVVLTVDEIKRLFDCAQADDLLILQLLYGAGLRLMEVVRLRVKDIDFDNNLIFVRSGKGDKDRATMLPEIVKRPLEKHLEKIKALHEDDVAGGEGEVYLPAALERKYPNAVRDWGWQYVFSAEKLSVDPRSGKIRRHHISPSSIQKTMKKTVQKAGFIKNATVHTLRHSFATHLLMNGVNLREIQDLLGHKNVETTMVYTHVLRDMANVPKSPLDNMYNIYK